MVCDISSCKQTAHKFCGWARFSVVLVLFSCSCMLLLTSSHDMAFVAFGKYSSFPKTYFCDVFSLFVIVFQKSFSKLIHVRDQLWRPPSSFSISKAQAVTDFVTCFPHMSYLEEKLKLKVAAAPIDKQGANCNFTVFSTCSTYLLQVMV